MISDYEFSVLYVITLLFLFHFFVFFGKMWWNSNVVPEYSFLDARGLGAYEGRPLQSVSEVRLFPCIPFYIFNLLFHFYE